MNWIFSEVFDWNNNSQDIIVITNDTESLEIMKRRNILFSTYIDPSK